MKVSIIVTSYNYGYYLDRCLRSCLSQNFPSNQYEVLAVDDASTDNSVEVLKRHADRENFRFIVNESNQGVGEAANKAIRNCRGRYFVRVDADDYISENLIFLLSYYLDTNPDAFCVSCDYHHVDDLGSVLERKFAQTDPISCGIMYRTDLIMRFGLYNEQFRHREEEELRARLGEIYKIHHLRYPLYRYRLHNSNKTRNLEEMGRFKGLLGELYGTNSHQDAAGSTANAGAQE